MAELQYRHEKCDPEVHEISRPNIRFPVFVFESTIFNTENRFSECILWLFYGQASMQTRKGLPKRGIKKSRSKKYLEREI